ncbi:MAG: damage-control phosphatase ARMT1 family protein [Limisphaerales bacterium]|jgi:uncharacterized protein with ATP-grasp and redox domains|nr:ARMT1-like domain-containing protein [Verrucomicrobiota bacterium]
MMDALDCIPCLVRQSLHVARMATPDEAIHEEVLRKTLRYASELNLRQAPLLSQWVYQEVRKQSGLDDPFLEVKRESNRMAWKHYSKWKEIILKSDTPLVNAARMAIAGNIIDYGVNANLDTDDIPALLEKSYEDPLLGEVDEFLDTLREAKDILYLADNAGEIVFDRLFIELLNRDGITVVVKGGPAINDALMEDAQAARLQELCQVIDNGNDGPGTLLDYCSPEFVERFKKADMVIAKGQANYETLVGYPRSIYFLLKVKCPLVGTHIGSEVGSLVIHKNKFTAPQTESQPAPAETVTQKNETNPNQKEQKMTPMGDGTGPMGQGPKSGKGMGPCGGGRGPGRDQGQTEGQVENFGGRGMGRGRGGGMGRGQGGGRGRGMGAGGGGGGGRGQGRGRGQA